MAESKISTNMIKYKVEIFWKESNNLPLILYVTDWKFRGKNKEMLYVTANNGKDYYILIKDMYYFTSERFKGDINGWFYL